jgi:hypothetical protein
MFKITKTKIYVLAFIVLIVVTFYATWVGLKYINGDAGAYAYDNILTKELHTYGNYSYYFGPKDVNSKLISYNNAIIRKNNKTNHYKLIIPLNDEETTLMRDNSLFYKKYFYIIGSDVIRYDLTAEIPSKTKKKYEGCFINNASVSEIYGVYKKWIYVKVKLFKETDNHSWYTDKYYRIKFNSDKIYEIPHSMLPEKYK